MDDIEAIKQLKARYFRTLDTKDWEGYRQVFTDDVVIDTTGSGRRSASPVAMRSSPTSSDALAGATTVHQGHMPEINAHVGHDRHRDLGAPTTSSSGLAACVSTATATITRPTSKATTDGASGQLDADPAPRRFRRARGGLMATAAITGGASGFGRALGERCAALGMDVMLLDLDGERAVAEATRLRTHGRHGRRRGATRPASRRRPPRWGSGSASPTWSISNVGVQLFGSVEAFTDDEWRWLLDVNVVGTARVAHAFLPLLCAGPLAADSGVHHVGLGAGPGKPHGCVPSQQVRGLGTGGDPHLVGAAGDGIAVSVVFPSGMISRHLATSEAAQPEHLGRPIANEGDLDAMIASNPGLARSSSPPRTRRPACSMGSWPASPTSSPTATSPKPLPDGPRCWDERPSEPVEEQAPSQGRPTEAGLRR